MTGARDESMKTCNAVPSSLVIQKVSELKLGKQNKLSLTQIRSPHCGPQGLTWSGPITSHLTTFHAPPSHSCSSHTGLPACLAHFYLRAFALCTFFLEHSSARSALSNIWERPEIWVFEMWFGAIWLAQLKEQVTLDLGVLSSSPMLGVEKT